MASINEISIVINKYKQEYQQRHIDEMEKILKDETEGRWMPLQQRTSTRNKGYNYQQRSESPIKMSDGYLCRYCFISEQNKKKYAVNHQEVCSLNFNSYHRAEDRRKGIYIFNDNYICGFCGHSASSSRKALTNHILAKHKGKTFTSMKFINLYLND